MKKILILFSILCSAHAFAQDDALATFEDANQVSDFSDLAYVGEKNGDVPELDVLSGSSVLFLHEGLPQINDNQLMNMVQNNNYARKAKRLKTWGWIGAGVFGVIGVVGIIGGASESSKGRDSKEGYYIGGGAIVVGAVWTTTFLMSSHHFKNKSMYMVRSTPLWQNDIKFKNGTSLATGVDVLRDNTFRHNTVGLGLRYQF